MYTKKVINSSIFIILLSMIVSTAYGGKEMDFLYNISESRSLAAQAFKSRTTNLSLMPVPQSNAVGTNDIGNAISIISFSGSTVHYDTHFRNAVDDIGGGGIYIPTISKEKIGFGQCRSFYIFDFKRRLHHEFDIEKSINKYIEEIGIADADKQRFIFEVKAYNSKSNDHNHYSYSLKLVDLSGDSPFVIKKIDTGNATVWASTSNRVFLHNLESQEVQVLNMLLEPDSHPLADAIKKHKGKTDFVVMHPHPYLPFAILSGGRKGSMLIAWGEGREDAPHFLISRATQFSFSPDGRWVVFKKELSLDEQRTYLMPVSEKYPHYLGSPILLLNYDFGKNNAAWTTNPISFVGSRNDEIYRWELTNEAHPESDKATFWDYIVERDLAKLTKEKRQGLGKESNTSSYHK